MTDPPQEPITVVVADDHPVVRQGIVSLIDSEDGIEVVAEVGDGASAVDAMLRLRPSMLLTDLRMPYMDGVEATSALIEEWPEAIVLVLTTYDTDEAIVRAVESGACGYLLKDAPPDDLVDAMRRAVAGETVLAPPVAKRLMERVRSPHGTALSGRELEVLRAVAQGSSNPQIAKELFISQATVKTHLGHIYDKLGVTDRAAAVARAYETGLLGH